ncbi:MAG: flagellar motor switch protein FliN [Acidobacteriia bacterium]|nr:flagellar motor switch protein FliN [Terriglobia bacterium]
MRLEAVENARLLLGQWGESLAQVLESMTDQRPEVGWRTASGPFTEIAEASGSGPLEDILWWEQPFQVSPEMSVWVAAPRATWEYCGTLTLKAAGLETVELGEARNTWFEILGQSLSAMARSIGALLGREVTCETGVERSPDPETREWAAVSLKFAELSLAPLFVTLSPKLVAMISAPPPAGQTQPHEIVPQPPEPSPPEPSPPRSRTMDLLLDVDLPVSISFGRAQLPMKDILKLTTGSIVELNRGVSEQVEVLVNNCLIARGEVVVVDGNYGVRIQEIASRQDRLRTLR